MIGNLVHSAAGTGPAKRAYCSVGVVSPLRICSQFIRTIGNLALDEAPGDPLLPLVGRALAEKQMADDDRNRRIDQPAAGQVEIGRGLAS